MQEASSRASKLLDRLFICSVTDFLGGSIFDILINTLWLEQFPAFYLKSEPADLREIYGSGFSGPFDPAPAQFHH